jgi:hypothetical protein
MVILSSSGQPTYEQVSEGGKITVCFRSKSFLGIVFQSIVAIISLGCLLTVVLQLSGHIDLAKMTNFLMWLLVPLFFYISYAKRKQSLKPKID